MNIVSVFEVLLVSLSRSLKTINNMKNSGFTFRKRLASFRYAFNGIRLLIQKEHNAWIHCFAAICVVIAGFFFGLSQTEWIAVVIVIGAVLSDRSSIEVYDLETIAALAFRIESFGAAKVRKVLLERITHR